MMWQAEPLIAGTAHGEVLRLDAPISFWGGVDPATSCITLAGHPQVGQAIAGTVLVIPQTIGSSSSSAVLLELISAGKAPVALVLGNRDAILPVGVVVARQMGLPGLPVMLLSQPPFETGYTISIAADGSISKD
jgi:predicted aconitase with swiveling domain